jgi:hypothetical protein
MVKLDKVDLFYICFQVFTAVCMSTLFFIDLYNGERGLALINMTFVLVACFMFCIDAHFASMECNKPVHDFFNYNVF